MGLPGEPGLAHTSQAALFSQQNSAKFLSLCQLLQWYNGNSHPSALPHKQQDNREMEPVGS